MALNSSAPVMLFYTLGLQLSRVTTHALESPENELPRIEFFWLSVTTVCLKSISYLQVNPETQRS